MRLGCHRVVDFLLAPRVVELASVLPFQEEEVGLNEIVCLTLLSRDAEESGYKGKYKYHRSGYLDILLIVGQSYPLELKGVVLIKAIDQPKVYRNVPYKACRAVEYAPHTTSLSCHTSQLPVDGVEDVSCEQHQQGDDVHQKTLPAAVVEATINEESSA